MYLLLMRPEQKKRKDMERLLAGIKKNDHVVTIGGIFGTVVLANPGSKSVTIRVDDGTGTKLKVLRSAISQVGAVDDGCLLELERSRLEVADHDPDDDRNRDHEMGDDLRHERAHEPQPLEEQEQGDEI